MLTELNFYHILLKPEPAEHSIPYLALTPTSNCYLLSTAPHMPYRACFSLRFFFRRISPFWRTQAWKICFFYVSASCWGRGIWVLFYLLPRGSGALVPLIKYPLFRCIGELDVLANMSDFPFMNSRFPKAARGRGEQGSCLSSHSALTRRLSALHRLSLASPCGPLTFLIL